MMEYPIPKSSAQAWRAHKNEAPQNPGLIFDRFVQDWGAIQHRDKEAKKKAWREIEQITRKADHKLLRAWNARWEVTVHTAHAEPFPLKTDWRLIAGLGRKGPLEAGFTFHPYGFPILPGSSVKGIARARGLIRVAEKLSTTELTKLDDLLSLDDQKKYEEVFADRYPHATEEARTMAGQFRAIFGTTSVAGRALFFDAIPGPGRIPTLELDIMNPHFSEYYQDQTGQTPPADWQSPEPIYFLTVAAGMEFRFAVGWRGPLDAKGQRLRKRAVKWLQAGLQELGAGAKTSAGYGYFTDVQALTEIPSVREPSTTTAQPEPPVTPQQLTWRTGTVKKYDPGRGKGRLVDAKSGEELSFTRDAIEDKGYSPGKKHRVRYAVVEREGRRQVVKVRRL